MKGRKPFTYKRAAEQITMSNLVPIPDAWRQFPPEVIEKYLRLLFGNSYCEVKDNGDGTYTHTWMMPDTRQNIT